MSLPVVGGGQYVGAPHNLVRLVYLDEAGTTSSAGSLAVAGVIVHGDDQWRVANQRIVSLIEKQIPEADRDGFVFHATDLFHGSRYFHRSKPEWTKERRWAILEDLAQIIADLELPVVAGTHEKLISRIGDDGQLHEEVRDAVDLHWVAVTDCLFWADTWLSAYAPSELATVVHEDGPEAKQTIKEAVRLFRDPNQIAPSYRDYFNRLYGLPFQNIIDTVHFAEKSDARLLQLADLCAFMVSRAVQGREVPQKVMRIILERLDWIMQFRGLTTAISAALAGISQ